VMTTPAWSIALATGVAGFAAGWLVAAPPGAPPAASSFVLSAPVPAPDLAREPHQAPTPRDGISLDDVRRVVREELAAAGTGGSAAAPASQEAADEPSPAQLEAMGRASTVLDGALARRLFTEADRDSMRAEFHQLSPRQQTEIMRRYSVAVNQGRIVPESEWLPF